MSELSTDEFAQNVGIEIECPFSFYYPDIWQTHFESGKKKYSDFSDEERLSLDALMKEREPAVLGKIETLSNELGLRRGRDKYWEFVFPATKDKENIIHTIETLVREGLLPDDRPLSFQMTVGSLKEEHAYAILFFLEKEFLSQERALKAFDEKDLKTSWDRKGISGLTVKHKMQLEYGDEYACELRTLAIRMSEVPKVLDRLQNLLTVEKGELTSEARREMEAMGLPWTKWGEDEMRKFAENLKFR